jgi:hypothetical protein
MPFASLSYPGRMMGPMQPVVSLRFAHAVRQLTATTRANDLALPGFRSPPRVAGAQRTLRWRDDGTAVVAVQLRGRPWPAVLADLVEGVVVANRLQGLDAEACRRLLWDGLGEEGAMAA